MYDLDRVFLGEIERFVAITKALQQELTDFVPPAALRMKINVAHTQFAAVVRAYLLAAHSRGSDVSRMIMEVGCDF
jgi:hypothetical protein